MVAAWPCLRPASAAQLHVSSAPHPDLAARERGAGPARASSLPRPPSPSPSARREELRERRGDLPGRPAGGKPSHAETHTGVRGQPRTTWTRAPTGARHGRRRRHRAGHGPRCASLRLVRPRRTRPDPPTDEGDGTASSPANLEACGDLSQYDEVVYGTAGDDTLVAGAGRQVLVGLGGDDVLDGGDGDDCLVGGSGGDELIGDAADDELDGGPGADATAPTDDGVLVPLEDATTATD